MGSGRWDAASWASYATSHVAGKPASAIFGHSMHAGLDPAGIRLRESRDSADNPCSNAIIVAGDVTGSMGEIAHHLMQTGLNDFATALYARRPVSDPHLMFAAIGDAACDRSPLQVTQFEADIRIAEQLAKFHLEGGGGGNDSESYHLPWWFAARRTAIDCFEKRGQKGVIFTYGDECVPEPLTPAQADRVFGETIHQPLSAESLLAMASRSYDVYHLVIEEGSYARRFRDQVYGGWRGLLGERAIPVGDHTRLAEIMVSLLQLRAGLDPSSIRRSWSGATAVTVAKAIDGIRPGSAPATGLVHF